MDDSIYACNLDIWSSKGLKHNTAQHSTGEHQIILQRAIVFDTALAHLRRTGEEVIILRSRLFCQPIAFSAFCSPFGKLRGISSEVHFGLLALKQKDGQMPEVHKFLTWRSMRECLVYLLRRAVEIRDAVSRTGDELNAPRSEVWRRMMAVFITS